MEIGGDTTGLDKALKGVNSNIKNTQAQLKDVEKLLKLDPKNTELLAQKQRLLGDAVNEVKNKLGTLKEAEKQVQEQVKRGEASQAQYDALKREIASTSNELKNLEKQAAQSNATFAKVGAVAGELATKTANLADKTKGLSLAAGGALTALGGMAYSAVTGADDLNTLAKQTGISTEMLQKAQYAADLIDVSFETFTGSIAKMTAKLRTNEQGFNDFGIATRNANGDLLSSEEIFFNAAKALSEIENETERDIAAQELFGKSAADLAGIIDDGGEALKAYGQQAEDLGLIMSQDTLNGLNEVNDKIDTLKANVKGTLAKTGAKALEALTPVLEKVANAIGNVLEWIGNLDEGTLNTIVTILAIVAALTPVISLISGIVSVIQILTPVMAALNAVMAANPIGIIIIAVAALVAAFITLWKKCDGFRKFFIDLWDGIKGAVSSVIDWFVTAWEDVSTFFTDLWNDIQSVVDTVVTWIKDNWQAMLLFLISPLAGVFKYCYDNFEGFRDFVDNVVEKVKGFFTDLWDGIETGFGTVVNWIQEKVDAIKDFFKGLGDDIKSIWDGIWGGIKGVINSIIGGINSMISAVCNGINTVVRAVNTLHWEIPDYVPIVGGKTFGFDLKEITAPQIPLLAKGGILKKGEVGLLEGNGAEAVVPLDQNQKWIAAVAQDMMGAFGSMQNGAQVGTQINIYPQSLDNSTVDYLFTRFNAKMGAMA